MVDLGRRPPSDYTLKALVQQLNHWSSLMLKWPLIYLMGQVGLPGSSRSKPFTQRVLKVRPFVVVGE